MKCFSSLSRAVKHCYDIPDQYQNSFYLANASLFQIINYFVHISYQHAFPELVEKAKTVYKDYSDVQARNKIRECIKSLEYCNAFLDLHFPIKRQQGGYEIVRGMRAYHCLPFQNKSLGGFRMYEDLTRHTAQGFAVLSAYRNACFDLDFAGSNGGLRIDAQVYDPKDMREVVQTYIKNLQNFRGTMDVIEPDLFCTDVEIGYMNEVCGDNVFVVGKSEESGGLKNYSRSGPQAAITTMQTLLSNPKITSKIGLEGPIREKTFILHGLGKTGIQIAKLMSAAGAICVGVRVHDCILYDTAGIPVKPLLKHYRKYGTILNFSPKARELGPADSIFTELCDILILAAKERSVVCHIADKIKAKVILEACNGPITPTADKILVHKQKLVIPSILAGGGYTLMSCLEWLASSPQTDKNLVERINQDPLAVLDEKVKETTEAVIKIEEELNLMLNFRAAAFVKAIRKIFAKMLSEEFVEQEKMRASSMQ